MGDTQRILLARLAFFGIDRGVVAVLDLVRQLHITFVRPAQFYQLLLRCCFNSPMDHWALAPVAKRHPDTLSIANPAAVSQNNRGTALMCCVKGLIGPH